MSEMPETRFTKAGDIDIAYQVMDAAGSGRAAIAAWGEGAAIAAMFAATHFERVTSLVLGSLPIKVTGERRSVLPDLATIQAFSAAVETGWGKATLVPVIACPGSTMPGSCPGNGGGSDSPRRRARQRRRCAGRRTGAPMPR